MENTKKMLPVGTTGTFSGYAEEDMEGPLTGTEGVTIEVTGFDSTEGTYNIKALLEGEEVEDSLYDDEFDLVKKAKPAAKKAAKKKVTKTKATSKKETTKKIAAKKKVATKTKATKTKATKTKATKTKATKTATKKKTVSATKKVAKNEVNDSQTEFKQTATVASTLKEYNNDACAAAYDWAVEAEKTNFVLGGLLAYIKRNDSHLDIQSKGNSAYVKGLKGFNEFVMDYLGVNKVRAHWLVRIYETFSQLNVTEKQIEEVGWTKARELLPLAGADLLTEENVDEWLIMAADGTTNELHEEVKKKLVDSGAKTHGNKKNNEQTNRKFVFFDHQAEVVDSIIARKKEELDEATAGDYPDSAALYAILTEYADLTGQETD